MIIHIIIASGIILFGFALLATLRRNGPAQMANPFTRERERLEKQRRMND